MSGNELNIPSKACSLDNYIRRKSADRSGFLSKKKSLTTNSKRHPTKQQKGQKACVSISVGIVRLSAHKELSIKRGSRVFVSVPRNANSDTVKKLAVDKHANLNQYFCALEDYVLLYPDTKVVEFLPGSNENFDVEKYKELLGKPFQKVDLYLCSEIDFISDISEQIDDEKHGEGTSAGCIKTFDSASTDVLDIDDVDDNVLNSHYLDKYLDPIPIHVTDDNEKVADNVFKEQQKINKVTCPICHERFFNFRD